MKKIVFAFFLLLSVGLIAKAQSRVTNGISKINEEYIMERLYDEHEVEIRPRFIYGEDSIRRYNFNNFTAIETILKNTIAHGDTGVYIRVYFRFTVDKNGMAADGAFEKVAATPYSKSKVAKTLRYFGEAKKELNESIQLIVKKMPTWKPALQYRTPVACEKEDYIQFWVGKGVPAE